MGQTPANNTDIRHEAAGNLSYLLAVIRNGDNISAPEIQNVRRVIRDLELSQGALTPVGEQRIAELERAVAERDTKIAELRKDAERPAQILKWATETFGHIATRHDERCMRFVEEAVELAQSMRMSRDVIEKIVTRVYSREKGDVRKELSQAGMTLEAFAEALGFNLSGLIDGEFARVRAIPMQEFQRRHAAKVELGIAADAALPASAPKPKKPLMVNPANPESEPHEYCPDCRGVCVEAASAPEKEGGR